MTSDFNYRVRPNLAGEGAIPFQASDVSRGLGAPQASMLLTNRLQFGVPTPHSLSIILQNVSQNSGKCDTIFLKKFQFIIAKRIQIKSRDTEGKVWEGPRCPLPVELGRITLPAQ